MTLCAYSGQNSQVLVSRSGLLIGQEEYSTVMSTAVGDLAVLPTALLTIDDTWVYMFEPHRRSDNRQWRGKKNRNART